MEATIAPLSVMDGESLITPETIDEKRALDAIAPRARTVRDADEARARLALTLQLAKGRFDAGRAASEIVGNLAGQLHLLRRECSPDDWRAVVPYAQSHALADILREDPFTDWSCRKPRGYSGDAGLLDFIYGHESTLDAVAAATPLGREIYAYTRNASSSVAVRERRALLAREVDAAAMRTGGGAEVLAIAAGYLREASLSEAMAGGGVARWVALDQDPHSVGTMTRDLAGTAVEAVDGSVRGLLKRSYALGTFDLAYAAGLYDYLPRSVAIRLTQRCMELVKPGGTFLFANFADKLGVDGYMETFMDWALLLRSQADMWDIVKASVDRNAIDAKVWSGENGNIVYASLTRRAD